MLDAAIRDGDVSYAKARVLMANLDASNAEALVDISRVTPAGRLGAGIAAWAQRNETPTRSVAVNTTSAVFRGGPGQTGWSTCTSGSHPRPPAGSAP